MAIDLNDIGYLVVIVFLMGMLLYSEMRNRNERKDLLDRILAKNLTELASYQNATRTVKVPDKPKRDQYIEM